MSFAGKTVVDVQTLFVNNYGSTKVFPYLPPHGRSLADGATATYDGDLRVRLANDRARTALQSDLEDGICAIYVRKRVLMPFTGKTASAIAVGDLLYLDSGEVRPAADITWDTNLATTQANFAKVFIGVAATAKAAAVAGTVWVDVSADSPYVITCTSETHDFGDTFAPKKASGNALLSNQIVKAVASSSCLKGIRKDSSASTTAVVTLQSTVYGGDFEPAAKVTALGGTLTGSVTGSLADSTALAGTLTGSVDGTITDVAAIALSTSNTYSDSAVNTAVNAAITSINLQNKELQTTLNALVTNTNLQLKELQTTVNAVISALKSAGLMRSV